MTQVLTDPGDRSALEIKLERFYSHAHERAGAAEKIMTEAVRGAVLLNGAAIAAIVGGLGVLQPTGDGKALSEPFIAFIVGAVLGAIAVAVFALATFFRAHHEFHEAEKLFEKLSGERSKYGGGEAWRRMYVVGFIIACALSISSIAAFGFGCSHLAPLLKTSTVKVEND